MSVLRASHALRGVGSGFRCQASRPIALPTPDTRHLTPGIRNGVGAVVLALGCLLAVPAALASDEDTRQKWLESTQVKVEAVKSWTLEAEDFMGHKVAIVEDPDASGGHALMAKKDVDLKWYMAVGTYSWRELYGRYRLTFRLKCRDLTPEPVIAVGIGIEGEAPASPKESVIRTLRGTDFAAAMQYQDVVVEFVRTDIGFIGYHMTFKGGADVWVDKLTVERTGDITDGDLIALYGGPELPVAPAIPATPRLLWVQGLYHRLDPAGAALTALGLPCDAAPVDEGQSGPVITGAPKKWDDLARYTVLLISDADPRAFSFRGRSLIKLWVEHGGTLIVTGGPFALGKSLTAGTALEDILPVTLAGAWDLVPGNLFQAAKPRPKETPRYRARCGAAWVHRVIPKPGAAVVLETKGDHRPVLISAAVGKGRVIVFTGTPFATGAAAPPLHKPGFWFRISRLRNSSLLTPEHRTPNPEHTTSGDFPHFSQDPAFAEWLATWLAPLKNQDSGNAGQSLRPDQEGR